MKAEKDPKTGKWLIQYRYTDWQGKRRKSMKRGFATKKEAETWVIDFLAKKSMDFDMKFKDFIELYFEDAETRLRENTMRTKKYIIDLKVTPYFGDKSLNNIKAADIRQWQNMLLKKGYSQTYLKTINNQISAIFNHAGRYYDLSNNPCKKAGSIGKGRAKEMKFWTQSEFSKFIDVLMDKQISYTAFMTLYWTGMRMGELMALYPETINFEKREITICRSYQRIDKRDVITEPKTERGIRVISIPEFLAADLKDYMDSIYGLENGERIFPFTKNFLEHEMKRGIKESGNKKIRVHDLRHSHASLLVEMGFSPLEIAKRLGHEKIETTLNTYSHLYPDSQVKLAEQLDKKFKEDL